MKTASASVEVLPNAANLEFVEALYAAYRAQPQSVSPEWREYFERVYRGAGVLRRPTFTPASIFNPVYRSQLSAEVASRQDQVDQLIRAYRRQGHMIANIDPLGLPRPVRAELEPEFYGLRPEDLDRTYSTRTIHGTDGLTLRHILDLLRNTYCRTIGVEFMHIHDAEAQTWLQQRMESTQNRLGIDPARQRQLATLLTDAVVLEEFIQKKYLGAKSFSLEGSESLIPLLHWAIHCAADLGVDEITLGMAHRGRLNVLANIMGKSPRDIFNEFEDREPELFRGRGDVKYHLGYSSDYVTGDGKQVHLSLCFNPSHLEYVNPVVLGRVRAKQDRAGDTVRRRKLALLVHGDAAFAGEGIVPETLNLSGLTGYDVGGTLHVIVNNQIGFTTPPAQARSTLYCTDVAKMLQVPLFHVNGEDPEAVAQVVNLAMDFRARFGRDAVIDMLGYRRHGHNETDEPAFTQPLMYRAIAQRPSIRESYVNHLLQLGGITHQEADAIALERREQLEQELSAARRHEIRVPEDWLHGYWAGYQGGLESEVEEVDTAVSAADLRSLLDRLAQVPGDFTPHPKIQKLLDAYREMSRGDRVLDWGAGELAALASLLTAGYPVRMTGQDVERGTFSHRHSVIHDVNSGTSRQRLAAFASGTSCEICNSPLSEAAVLGFEWGYSLDRPEGLVIWEAQFGDFCNVAQVIIDQFISSAEDKWKRLSGLVLLLPHGFEGMGPEHSSARLERFLTLAAEDNMQIVQPTTPAQVFHLLRRQVLRRWRKPLIVFTPKSLLRHPRATSSLEDVATGPFQRVLQDPSRPPTDQVKRILLCSGRVYYELEQHRQQLDRADVAIVRIEQLYPLPKKALAAALDAYAPGTPAVWVQDEPANMGPWMYLRVLLGERIFGRFPLSDVCRDPSASPATGSASSHRIEQQELLARAF